MAEILGWLSSSDVSNGMFLCVFVVGLSLSVILWRVERVLGLAHRTIAVLTQDLMNSSMREGRLLYEIEVYISPGAVDDMKHEFKKAGILPSRTAVKVLSQIVRHRNPGLLEKADGMSRADLNEQMWEVTNRVRRDANLEPMKKPGNAAPGS